MLRPLPALALLAAGACASYHTFDSTSYLRGEIAARLGPEAAAQVDIPFEIDREAVGTLQRTGHLSSGEERKTRQVLDFIFERLKLRYSLNPTRDATATFHARSGNCLSFVNLFVGLARGVGLNPFYVEVTDYQTWNHRQGMVISQGHIVAGMYVDGELKTYDFIPYHPKSYRRFKAIDDLTAVAHYYNNLGAEALLAGDLAGARRLLGIAAAVAPAFDKGLNNLGVCLARGGDYEGALATYRKALALDPANSMVLINMARVYQQTDRQREAEELLRQVEKQNTSNPFFFVYEGELALARGDTAKALDYMVRALRLDSDLPEVHLGLVKVYVALGDLQSARHFLARALKLDATDQEALHYARMLGK